MSALERLTGYTPNGEFEAYDLLAVQCAIADLEAQGWTEGEIVSKLKWLEHVNPLIDEDVAIRNMAAVNERVRLRKSIQYAVDQTQPL